LTYAVSKRLVKLPEHADLLPHLAQDAQDQPFRPQPQVCGTAAAGASTDTGTDAFTGAEPDAVVARLTK
jgi:hypothetical protein